MTMRLLSARRIPRNAGEEASVQKEVKAMSIKPQTGRRNYAKGGGVTGTELYEDLTQGGASLGMAQSLPGAFGGAKSAFVSTSKYPGWPQMAGIDGPRVKGGGGGEEE